jgi:chromosome segregation ATPase
MSELTFGERLTDSRTLPLPPSTWLSRLSQALEFRDRSPPQLMSLAGSSDSQRLIATCLHCLFSSSEPVEFTPEHQRTIEFAIRSFIQSTAPSYHSSDAPEVIALHKENAESVHRYSSLRRDLGQDIRRLEAELAASRERIQALTDELQVKNYQEERYKGELRQLSQTVLDRTSEVRDLRRGLAARKQEVADLEGQCRRASLRPESVETPAPAATAEPEGAVTALTEELEKASRELVALQAGRSSAFRLLAAQGKIIDELASQNAALEVQCKETADERFKLNEMSVVVSELQALTFVGHITDLPDYVRQLLEGGLAENQRLRACFEQLLSFTASLFGSPLLSTQPGLIEREVARYQQFLVENKVPLPRDGREELTIELLRTDLILKRVDQLQEQVSVIPQIAAIFHFSGDSHDLPAFVKQQLKRAFGGLRRLRLLYQIENDQELVNQIEADRALLEHFQTELSAALECDGHSSELPKRAAQRIKSMARTIAGQHSEFREQLDEIKRECEIQAARSTEYIADLEVQVNSSEMRLRELTESLEASDVTVQDMASHESSVRVTLAEIAQNYSALEEEYAALKRDNEDLKTELTETIEKAHARTTKLLAEERKQRDEEADELQVKFSSQIERFESSLKRKHERNAALKERIAQITDEYVQAFAAEKEVVRVLREKLDQANSAREKSDASLKAQIGRLRAQNNQLQTQISSFSDQLVQIEHARDQFWKAQIVLLEEQHEANSRAQQLVVTEQQRYAELLNEWETWAKNTCVCLSQQELASKTPNDLRFLLSEMILSSISHRTLLTNLRSLRFQKRLLIQGVSSTIDNQGGPSMRSVLTVTIAATRLIRGLRLRPIQ